MWAYVIFHNRQYGLYIITWNLNSHVLTERDPPQFFLVSFKWLCSSRRGRQGQKFGGGQKICGFSLASNWRWSEEFFRTLNLKLERGSPNPSSRWTHAIIPGTSGTECCPWNLKVTNSGYDRVVQHSGRIPHPGSPSLIVLPQNDLLSNSRSWRSRSSSFRGIQEKCSVTCWPGLVGAASWCVRCYTTQVAVFISYVCVCVGEGGSACVCMSLFVCVRMCVCVCVYLAVV